MNGYDACRAVREQSWGKEIDTNIFDWLLCRV